MIKSITKGIKLTILLMSFAFTSANAQSAAAKQPHYKDMVSENLTADTDIKLVSDYLHRLVSGEVNKAISMLTSNYQGYGPGPGDSSTSQMVGAPGTTMTQWNKTERMIL